MDFWGVDRGTTSLRFRALERIARMDVEHLDGDIERMLAVLKQRKDQITPLTYQELEVLLAVAGGAANMQVPTPQPELVECLGRHLLGCLDLALLPSLLTIRIAPCPWNEAARRLTEALIQQKAPAQVLADFCDRASDMWTHRDTVLADDDAFLIWAYAFQGFLRGLGGRQFDADVEEQLGNRLRTLFLAPDFRPDLLKRLEAAETHHHIPGHTSNGMNGNTGSNGTSTNSKPVSSSESGWSLAKEVLARCVDDPDWYPGPTQLTACMARVAVNMARVSQDLPSMARYAAHQLEEIEQSSQFRRHVNPHLEPVSAATMRSLFSVLHEAVVRGGFDREHAFNLVLRAVAEQADDSSLSITRLAAECVNQGPRDGADGAKNSDNRTSQLIALLPSFLGAQTASTAFQAARLAAASMRDHDVSESTRVTILYTLVKELTADEAAVRAASTENDRSFLQYVASVLSALVAVVTTFSDVQLSGLAVTILAQKYGTVNEGVNIQILETYALLAPHLSEDDFGAILEQILRAERRAWHSDSPKLIEAVASARVSVARGLEPGSLLHRIYLKHLLDQIVLRGEPQSGNTADAAHKHAYQTVRYLLAPLAALLPSPLDRPLDVEDDWTVMAKFRDAWFNLAMLGLHVDASDLNDTELSALKTVARSTPPLVSETSANHVESDLELNPVLRRGIPSGVFHQQRDAVAMVVPQKPGLGVVKTMFLASTLLLEGLRVRQGLVADLPRYFEDPDFRTGTGFGSMRAVARHSIHDYVRRLHLLGPGFALQEAAEQLKELLELCCHRVETVRRVASDLAGTIIESLPAVLCHRTSMYALLDLLTLMQESCIDAEEDEYEPRAEFVSARSGVRLELSDMYDARQEALSHLEKQARHWFKLLLDRMETDTKSLLAIYLEDPLTGDERHHDDGDGIGGARMPPLGRTFALEMGRSTHGDFLAQYLRSQGPQKTEFAYVVSEYSRLLQGHPTADDLDTVYALSSNIMASGPQYQRIWVVKRAVDVAFRAFTAQAISVGAAFWQRIGHTQPDLRVVVVWTVVDHWLRTIRSRKGLFSRALDTEEPLNTAMEYAPTNKTSLLRQIGRMGRLFAPHLKLLEVLTSMVHSSVNCKGPFLPIFRQFALSSLRGLSRYASMHVLARPARLSLLVLSLDILANLHRIDPHNPETALEDALLDAGLAWYRQEAPQWPYGGNRVEQRRMVALLGTILGRLSALRPSPRSRLWTKFAAQEHQRLLVWLDPLGERRVETVAAALTPEDVEQAWEVDPLLAVYSVRWATTKGSLELLVELLRSEPLAVWRCSGALQYLVDVFGKIPERHVALYWAQVSPIESINLLSPRFGRDSYLIQYALRSLEMHPIEKCFFYVPQIVQQLRYDADNGYVEEYILEAAKFSQKFAHQIIWNMYANSYMDDNGTQPDPMKPTLDRVLNRLRQSFTDDEQLYYDTEFGFFNEVTDISGKLKPFIKKSKVEKKAKIDEEMAKIKVPDGVYLPSNPDGTVVEIDRESGKPLQSHAKAPFLAKFKIHRDDLELGDDLQTHVHSYDVWQGAIFKVGDDCRQDLLALQIISVFRSIWDHWGLDLFVFPYKVTATAPGCGVIDVLPNSISRDMLGREAVNGLHEWFVSKYGGEDSIEFQRARNNFVKSMAAYSVISWLIQFKDRHNGNIMYDDAGHVIHIDFGFCFEIVPGGVRFEAAPFKLTKEMVAVMGGSPSAQPYKWFEELCVKAFLAARVYAEDICRMVAPMLDSGLPCFKGDTLGKLRGRFALGRSERDAAQYMRRLISRSYESNFTKGYDEFQRITNGIPY